MKATIFGAGNIGRGLVGAVLSDAGYELTFVDANRDLVDRLSDAGQYELITSTSRETIPVGAVVNASDEASVVAAVATSDIVATAVGPPILKIVAGPIAAGLKRSNDRATNVIACENVHPNSSALRAHVVDTGQAGDLSGVGFPDVVVDRIVPGDPGSLDVTAEPAYEFVIDQTNWSGTTPNITGITFTRDLSAYKLRKLWLVNGLHSITAWMGIQSDHGLIDRAIADPAILTAVESAAATMVQCLIESTDEFAAEDLNQYAINTIQRFANPDLGDETARVARNPLLKMARGERLMGPAAIADERGLDLDGLAAGIAAVIGLRDPSVPGAEAWADELESLGWKQFLIDRSGADPDGRLIGEVASALATRQKKKGTNMVTEEIVIENPAGLHARPAAQIVEQAKGLDATIQITKNNKVANANSIMSVLALGANTGDTVTVTAEGGDAASAVAAMREIMTAEEQ